VHSRLQIDIVFVKLKTLGSILFTCFIYSRFYLQGGGWHGISLADVKEPGGTEGWPISGAEIVCGFGVNGEVLPRILADISYKRLWSLKGDMQHANLVSIGVGYRITK
jgi:hypothetical protein